MKLLIHLLLQELIKLLFLLPTRTPPFSIKLTPGSTFGVKILQFFNAELDPGFFALDPGSGMKKFGSGYRDKTSQICNNRLYSPLITV
jgi:hypothetical protein